MDDDEVLREVTRKLTRHGTSRGINIPPDFLEIVFGSLSRFDQPLVSVKVKRKPEAPWYERYVIEITRAKPKDECATEKERRNRY
jgi:hypothetical protein